MKLLFIGFLMVASGSVLIGGNIQASSVPPILFGTAFIFAGGVIAGCTWKKNE